MEQANIFKIVVVGNGFAANLSALSLIKNLNQEFEILLLQPSQTASSDLLYGGLSSPNAYEEHRVLGILEPELFLNTSTSFAYGAKFEKWGASCLDWMQCFHLPLQSEADTHFHHFIRKHERVLGDYLISGQAAEQGKFAHPPVDNPRSALSRAEYGYQFDVQEWSKLYLTKVYKSKVNVIQQDIDKVVVENQTIQELVLASGQRISGDLFVDCTGGESSLLGKLQKNFGSIKRVRATANITHIQQTGKPATQIKGSAQSFSIETYLRKKIFTLNVESCTHDQDLGFEVGYRSKAWVGNCVGIGHSAYVLEPITCAPHIMLHRDIQRLLELIPVETDFSLESKEYNRRYINDYKHAELFHKAIYHVCNDNPYDECDLLTRKLEQFLHRGVIVNYDLEPFNSEDWLILFYGLGLKPNRYDLLADKISQQEMTKNLDTMKNGIAYMVSKMPPHDLYLEKFHQHISNHS